MNKRLILMGAVLLAMQACTSSYTDDTTTNNIGEQKNTSVDIATNNKPMPEKTLLEVETRDSIKPASVKLTETLSGFAKDSALMRIAFQQKVNEMNRAYMTGDYDRYVNFVLPSIIKRRGGKNAVISHMGSVQKSNPLEFNFIKSGPIDDLGEVVDEQGNGSGWYCIMPHLSEINNKGVAAQASGYMIGYSPDRKQFYFLDITSKKDEDVFFLMPDLQFIFPQLPKR